MKRTGILAAIAGLSCQALASAQTAVEPDDSQEFARPAVLGFETSVTLSSDRDVDWYRIAVPRPGRLQISGELDQLTVEVSTAEGASVEASGSQPGYVVEPGIYFVAFQGPARAEPYAFSLELADLRGLDGHLASDAPLPTATGQWSIRDGTRDEPLVFPLTLTDPSMFTMRFTYRSDDARRYRYNIQDDAGVQWPNPRWWMETQPDGAPQQVAALHLPPGRYNVSLYRDQIDGSEVLVSFDSGLPNDGFEPNDSRDLSRPITAPGQAMTLGLFPGDEDWFHLDVEAAGVLELIGTPSSGTDWGQVNWPEVYADTPPNASINRQFTDSNLARYWLPEAGRYFIRAGATSTGPVEWQLKTAFYPVGDVEGDSARLFLMGLDPGEELAITLDRIAEAGGGESLLMTADDMALGLSLATIAGSSRGRSLGVYGYAKAASLVVNQRLFNQVRPGFDPRVSIGVDFLAERGLFARNEETDPSLAAHARDTFTSQMLSPFPAQTDNDN